MYSDILVQQLGVKDAVKCRVQEAEKQDLIRLAQAGRPARPVRMRQAIGVMLITAGEWLRSSATANEGTARTASGLSR